MSSRTLSLEHFKVDFSTLSLVLAHEATLPQRLGVHDCCTFCARVLRAGWGPERDFSHHLGYTSRREAVKRLRASGGLRPALEEIFGPLRPASELSFGDLIWLGSPDTVGILMLSYVAVKGHHTIHRLQIDPRMSGWPTNPNHLRRNG